jgi:uncharacterized protein (TIGR02145 family)
MKQMKTMTTNDLLSITTGDCESSLRSVRNDGGFYWVVACGDHNDRGFCRDTACRVHSYRTFLFAFALAFFFCANLHAQVTIGGLENPKAGSILDLNSNVKGGLVLSNVTIMDVEKIPQNTNVFQGISNVEEDLNLRGAMVYNDGNGTSVPPGIYIWNGYCWTNDGREISVTAPVIAVNGTVQSSAIIENNPVGFAVVSPQEDVKYEWYESLTASSTDGDFKAEGETYSATLTAGMHYYYCKAISLSCSSFDAVSDVITLTVFNPALFTIGNGYLSGPTCFDIAYSNPEDGCGDLTGNMRKNRKRSFFASPTQVYTFSMYDNNIPSGLSLVYINKDASHPVIKSLEQNETSVTVTFHTELDIWTKGLTRADALKAELYAIYNGSYLAKLLLSVSDCQCCPGLLVVGGEYNQHDSNPLASLPAGYNSDPTQSGSAAKVVMEAFDNNGGKTGNDLCYYYRDANAINTWDNAVDNVCKNTPGIDAGDAHGGWRLPNLAELAQIGQLVSNYTTGGVNNDGIGSQAHVNTAISQGSGYSDGIAFPPGSYTTADTYNLINSSYWSSTERSSAEQTAWLWTYNKNYRYALPGYKAGSNSVRCVRSF